MCDKCLEQFFKPDADHVMRCITLIDGLPETAKYQSSAGHLAGMIEALQRMGVSRDAMVAKFTQIIDNSYRLGDVINAAKQKQAEALVNDFFKKRKKPK